MTPPPNADTAWAEYCAAAQRLDAVRRGAAQAAGEQAQTVRAARDELTAVRARLIPQQARLRESGVPDLDLRPTPADATTAHRALAEGGPAAVLAALRQARSTADRADATLLGTAPISAASTAPARPAVRNLLVYGPFAAAVLVVQIALLLTAGGTPMSIYALGCGLTLPLFAVALAWVAIGWAFPAPEGQRADRTLPLGAALCFAPILVTLVGTAVMAVTN